MLFPYYELESSKSKKYLNGVSEKETFPEVRMSLRYTLLYTNEHEHEAEVWLNLRKNLERAKAHLFSKLTQFLT